MGFYIRKCINAGPFRFNLSKSGIGVSTGIKGLRIGTGPRGNYIHMGYGGLYYRKTLNGPNSSIPASPQNQNIPLASINLNPAYTNYQEIESGDVSAMVDSSSAELLVEFDKKRKIWRKWPWIACLCMGLFFWGVNAMPAGSVWILVALSAIAIYLAYNYDQINKSVVLFYDLEPDFEKVYEELHNSFNLLKSSQKVWHISSQADILDRKRHAGASQAISRNAIIPVVSSAPYVKTNISIPSIPVGKQTLFFFPDRLLVFENDRVGAVSYADLEIRIEGSRFIEEGMVPKDALVVDHTWRYVNKSGGPDRRFNNNRQLPICQYEDMNLISTTGLNERVGFSKIGNATNFQYAISQLAGILLSNKSNSSL